VLAQRDIVTNIIDPFRRTRYKARLGIKKQQARRSRMETMKESVNLIRCAASTQNTARTFTLIRRPNDTTISERRRRRFVTR